MTRMSEIGLVCLVVAGALVGIGCDIHQSEEQADCAIGTPPSSCLDHYGLQLHPRAEMPTAADCEARPQDVWQGKTISVSGAVNTPGDYEMVRPDLTLLDAMAMAKGLAHTKPRYIYVIRAPSAGLVATRTVAVDVERLWRGDASLNVFLRPGDLVHVPQVTAGEVYVFGRVNRPGIYDLTGDSKTVSAILTKAGGCIGETWPAGSTLIRRPCRCNYEETISLDVEGILRGEKEDIVLRPNDVICATEGPTVICTPPEGGWPTTPPDDAPAQRFTRW